jgi:CDP-2,3-bis-(O-geranylgeranyl)-sn-glycerol synthase
MRLPPSSQAWGLDQIPEVLLPAWVARAWFDLGVLDVAAIVLVFFVLEVVLSKLLYRLKLRDRPY